MSLTLSGTLSDLGVRQGAKQGVRYVMRDATIINAKQGSIYRENRPLTEHESGWDSGLAVLNPHPEARIAYLSSVYNLRE